MTAHPMAQPLDRERVQLSRAQSQGKLTRQSAWPCWVPSGLGSCITYPGRSHTPRAQVQASGVCGTAIVCTCMCAHHVYVYMCMCVCVRAYTCAHMHMCFCVCIENFSLLSLTGSLRGPGAEDFNICKESGPIAKGESPIAWEMLKTVMVFPARLGGGDSSGSLCPGTQSSIFQLGWAEGWLSTGRKVT